MSLTAWAQFRATGAKVGLGVNWAVNPSLFFPEELEWELRWTKQESDRESEGVT